jgi:hypothetical protein
MGPLPWTIPLPAPAAAPGPPPGSSSPRRYREAAPEAPRARFTLTEGGATHFGRADAETHPVPRLGPDTPTPPRLPARAHVPTAYILKQGIRKTDMHQKDETLDSVRYKYKDYGKMAPRAIRPTAAPWATSMSVCLIMWAFCWRRYGALCSRKAPAFPTSGYVSPTFP